MFSAQSLLTDHQPETLPIQLGDDTLNVTYNVKAITPDFLDGMFTRPIRHLLADILLHWDLPTSPDDASPYVPAPLTEDEIAGLSPVATVVPVAAPATTGKRKATTVDLANALVPLTPAQIETERKNRWRLLLGPMPQDFLLQVYDQLREDFRPGKRRATS